MIPTIVITLHTFPGRHGLESLSPFCMKVEVYLKMCIRDSFSFESISTRDAAG